MNSQYPLNYIIVYLISDEPKIIDEIHFESDQIWIEYHNSIYPIDIADGIY